IEQWSQQVGQAAIDEYWEDDGATVTREQFLAQVNAWAYVARDFGPGAFYIMAGVPEVGVNSVMTVRYLNEDVYKPEDYHEYLKSARDIQSNLVTPIEFETLEVPAGPAAHSSYRMTDFFNGVDTLVFRDNYLIFPPNVNAAVEISASWVDDEYSWVIKEETLKVAKTLRIVPKDYKGT
ncbi:hypothetical protein, partial [Haematomicrobium sanguinis]|uniref:hypothetical protein n=1 Tax=Haematomicrobium sanguinis TaxID=479106 RepID=UPI0005527A5E